MMAERGFELWQIGSPGMHARENLNCIRLKA